MPEWVSHALNIAALVALLLAVVAVTFGIAVVVMHALLSEREENDDGN